MHAGEAATLHRNFSRAASRDALAGARAVLVDFKRRPVTEQRGAGAGKPRSRGVARTRRSSGRAPRIGARPCLGLRPSPHAHEPGEDGVSGLAYARALLVSRRASAAYPDRVAGQGRGLAQRAEGADAGRRRRAHRLEPGRRMRTRGRREHPCWSNYRADGWGNGVQRVRRVQSAPRKWTSPGTARKG